MVRGTSTASGGAARWPSATRSRARLGPFRGAGAARCCRARTIRSSRSPALAPFDAQTIAQRIAELGLGDEERDVLEAELEALAHGYLDDAGAVSVLRWHALSGYSLELTQETGGVYTFGAGTRGADRRDGAQAPFAQWLSTPVDSIGRVSDGVEVRTRDGDVLRARTCVLTVPLNVLPQIRFDDALGGQARRDRARPGVARHQALVQGERRGRAASTPSRRRTRSATS